MRELKLQLQEVSSKIHVCQDEIRYQRNQLLKLEQHLFELKNKQQHLNLELKSCTITG